MLLLVTIGLVLVGAVSLVIGFVSNSLPPIYLSIACSVIAGIVLVVFSRMSKRQEAGGPSSTGFTPAPSAGSWTPPPPPTAPPAAPSYRPPSVPSPASEPERAAAPASRASAVAVDDFPIDGYDTLRVSQILPALEDLDLDDLDLVREREEEGKNRTTVLRRIDVLMDERETQDGPAAVAPAGLHTMDDDLDDDLDDEHDDEGLEGEIEDNFVDGMAVGEDDDYEDEDYEDEDDFVGDMAGEEEPTAVVPAAAAAPAAGSFPIPGYDRLPVAQILPLLDDLDDDELDRVAEYEEKGKNRAAILDRIDDMFEPIEDEAPAPIPVPAPPVPAKKAPAKKAPAKKATAKTAVAKKAAVAKKVAPVKAGPAKKAPVKKAAVEKAAVKKVAPAKRPSPVTRTATKKAAPAKRPPAPAKKVVKKR